MKPGYCRKAPVIDGRKAHHWMFEPQGTHNANRAKCKYCGKRRQFNHEHPFDTFDKSDIHTSTVGQGESRLRGKKVP